MCLCKEGTMDDFNDNDKCIPELPIFAFARIILNLVLEYIIYISIALFILSE